MPCKRCGGPCVTRPSEKYPQGRVMEGASLCELCAIAKAQEPPKPTARVTVLDALGREGQTIGALVEATGIPLRTVSHALDALRKQGDASWTRRGGDGKQVRWRKT